MEHDDDDQAGDGPVELTDTEKARWQAVRSSVDALSEGLRAGTLDRESVQTSLAQIGEVDVDLARVRDALDVPEDAGEYEAGLIAILLRIPDGWGRWISCDRGWYPLVCDLDAALANVDPAYRLEQAKEKYGQLSYYASTELGGEDQERFRALIREAEQRSASICELCGDTGVLCEDDTGEWFKTLCHACQAEREFTPVDAEGEPS